MNILASIVLVFAFVFSFPFLFRFYLFLFCTFPLTVAAQNNGNADIRSNCGNNHIKNLGCFTCGTAADRDANLDNSFEIGKLMLEGICNRKKMFFAGKMFS